MRSDARSATTGRRYSQAEDPQRAPDDFLSGTAGHVTGLRPTAKALLADGLDRCAAMLSLEGTRIDRAARSLPRQQVLALAVQRADSPNLLRQAQEELLSSRHRPDLFSAEAGDRGKFENLNALLAAHPPLNYHWLLVIDDDVTLPRGFLDRFLFLCERFDLTLAQPAHRHRSNAAWQVTRRRRGSLVRDTAFVEIGPVTAFRRNSFETLLPFPPLRSGWGLDVHWSALARTHGWRTGIVDATAIRHGLRPVAASYDTSAAVAEAREFLRERPYLDAREAQRTLHTHRRLPGARRSR